MIFKLYNQDCCSAEGDTGWTVNTPVIFNLKKLHSTERDQQFMKNYGLEKTHTEKQLEVSSSKGSDENML